MEMSTSFKQDGISVSLGDANGSRYYLVRCNNPEQAFSYHLSAKPDSPFGIHVVFDNTFKMYSATAIAIKAILHCECSELGHAGIQQTFWQSSNDLEIGVAYSTKQFTAPRNGTNGRHLPALAKLSMPGMVSKNGIHATSVAVEIQRGHGCHDRFKALGGRNGRPIYFHFANRTSRPERLDPPIDCGLINTGTVSSSSFDEDVGSSSHNRNIDASSFERGAILSSPFDENPGADQTYSPAQYDLCEIDSRDKSRSDLGFHTSAEDGELPVGLMFLIRALGLLGVEDLAQNTPLSAYPTTRLQSPEIASQHPTEQKSLVLRRIMNFEGEASSEWQVTDSDSPLKRMRSRPLRQDQISPQRDSEMMTRIPFEATPHPVEDDQEADVTRRKIEGASIGTDDDVATRVDFQLLEDLADIERQTQIAEIERKYLLKVAKIRSRKRAQDQRL